MGIQAGFLDDGWNINEDSLSIFKKICVPVANSLLATAGLARGEILKTVTLLTSEATMELTTTPSMEGRTIIRYCGVVAGEAVLGANIFKDMFAGIRDIVGGRSGSYEKELRKARKMALDELAEQARELGANAVVGIDIDYEVLGEKNGMLMVSASGTAVVVESVKR